MKICIVGDFSKGRDEGLKNIAQYLADEISKYHETLKFDIRNILSIRNLVFLKRYQPDIIHYVPGPTIKSFFIAKFLKKYCKAKIILSAPQPKLSLRFRKLIHLLKPDLVLIQSKKSRCLFNLLGIETAFLTNGVDINKFIPVSENIKRKLREKYMLDPNKFTILHVGHLTQRRNLEIFTKIKDEDKQIIIVASKYMATDKNLYKKLSDAGCIIFSGYYKNIEEFYALADCYIFPVRPGHTILTPLSVLEAMSTNLLVITTKFEGLITLFEEGDGLIFVENEKEIFSKLENVEEYLINIDTRKKVLPYSWENIGKKLNKIYINLISRRFNES